MDDEGEAQLINVVREDPFFQFGAGFTEDQDILKEAEEGCPVDIIRIG
jgi:ferredoxin